MSAAITAAQATIDLAESAVRATAGKRDKLLTQRSELGRVVDDILQTDRLAALEGLTAGAVAAEMPKEAKRRLQAAQRTLEAMPSALGQAEVDLATARNHLEAAKVVRWTSIGRYVADEMTAEVSDIEANHVAPMLEKLARLAGLELVRERLIGSQPISEVDLGRPVFSGRVVALNTFAGLPLRIRGNATSDQIMARAAVIADSLQAQITKGK